MSAGVSQHISIHISKVCSFVLSRGFAPYILTSIKCIKIRCANGFGVSPADFSKALHAVMHLLI